MRKILGVKRPLKMGVKRPGCETTGMYDDLPIHVQLMLRFINSYLDVITSTNHVVSLCSQLCSWQEHAYTITILMRSW